MFASFSCSDLAWVISYELTHEPAVSCSLTVWLLWAGLAHMSGGRWMMRLICDGLGMDDWVNLALLHMSFISRRLAQTCFIEI